MTLWGYEKIDETADDFEPKPLSLREASFLLSFKELARIREFLDCAEKELQVDEQIMPQAFHHVHFRDWYPGWKEGDPDLIVCVDMSKFPPEEA